MAYKIYKITDCSPVDYAAEELKKYLRMMMPEAGDVKIERACGKPPVEDGFCLGLMQDFGISTDEVEDVYLDDILHIDTTDTAGIIAGSNPRSVLMAVYRFLRENGCRWLYPGVDGEFIPMQTVKGVKYHKAADMRYRGWCNEGAESQQCMMETIELAPKLGMNVYMIEFFNPHGYYDRYYKHMNNEANRLPEPISEDQALQWKRLCEAEIEKRGLQFHDIGHGWTAEALGLNSIILWDDLTDLSVPKDKEHLFAMLDGKRQLYSKGPINTNMCMSNPEARRLFVNKVADYAEAHRNITYLHVWLADSWNNQCECEKCREMIVSDWYVTILNELDDELTARKLNTKIVFCIYYETVWAPEKVKLKSTTRFSGLICPLGRRYLNSFEDYLPDSELEPFVLNRIETPKTIEKCFSRVRQWQRGWAGPVLSYEYHFFIFRHYDLGGLYYSRRIYEDILALDRANMKGNIEDGTQRPFFPNGLDMYVYAETLFDISRDYDEMVDEYFSFAYGTHAPVIKKYFEALTEIFEYKYMNGMASVDETKGPLYDSSRYDSFCRATGIVEEMREYVKANYKSDIRVQCVSMQLLLLYTEYVLGGIEVLKLVCRGLTDEANEVAEDFYEAFGRNEAAYERYYDHYMCVAAWRHRIAKGKKRNHIGV